MNDDTTQLRRRMLDNSLACAINALTLIKNSLSIPYEERLRAVVQVEKMMPEIRRMLIYFQNISKGH
jgi:hypothetical protein